MKDGKQCILAADDDPQILRILELLLTSQGYAVETAADGLEAAARAGMDIDLYLLDVDMPGQSGIQAAVRIRERSDAPIVFLTAYSGESDKIMGFSVGADDYIVKPFSGAELLMRIRAILRRSAPKKQENRRAIGDVTLDLDSQCALKNGQRIALTHTEFKILELLAANRGKIFSLEQIYRSVWNDNAVADSAIMVHIKNIRKKLGDDSRNPRYIRTAWGKGYYVD